ncbi:unnamed protein product, partial [Protopolystoma xenopodis]
MTMIRGAFQRASQAQQPQPTASYPSNHQTLSDPTRDEGIIDGLDEEDTAVQGLNFGRLGQLARSQMMDTPPWQSSNPQDEEIDDDTLAATGISRAK